jgi:hypothetical protein
MKSPDKIIDACQVSLISIKNLSRDNGSAKIPKNVVVIFLHNYSRADSKFSIPFGRCFLCKKKGLVRK